MRYKCVAYEVHNGRKDCMARKRKEVGTVNLRNPRTVRLIVEEQRRGAGRNVTEAAENLIAEAVESRRAKRAEEGGVG